MQQNTGCKINVSQPNGRDIERDIGLVGSRGAIEAAKRAIMDKVHAVVHPPPSRLLPFHPPYPFVPLPTFQSQVSTTNIDQGEKNRPSGANQSYRPDNYNQRDDNRFNNDRNDQYNSPQTQPSYEYNQPASGAQQPQSQPATGDADPYAAYGGYQNYVALWYQSLQAQGQGQQQGGQQGAGS